MSLNLNQKAVQKQKPSTIQLMGMIQMNAEELHSYLDRMMQENPVFEVEPYAVPAVSYRAPKRDLLRQTEDSELPEPADRASGELLSLYRDVCIQLDILRPEPPLLRAARFLAANMDERGYITREDYLFASERFGEELAGEALEMIQSLSPPGIGARSLAECLYLQLRATPGDTELAEKIAAENLELVSKGHFQQICKIYAASMSQVRQACELIRGLDPFPARGYGNSFEVQYVMPDLFMDKDGAVRLNSDSVPKLNMSEYYRSMLENNKDPEVVEFLNDKFRQAEQLVDNIQRRSSTILRCMNAIVAHQKAFFISQGHAALNPLTQVQLARQLELSESTISRVVNSKYIQTEFGIFPLSSFFTVAVGGGEQQVSSLDVKDRIRNLVDNEDKKAPLSDQDICDALSREGVPVSRRTVAKYRQQLNIPSTFARKKSE